MNTQHQRYIYLIDSIFISCPLLGAVCVGDQWQPGDVDIGVSTDSRRRRDDPEVRGFQSAVAQLGARGLDGVERHV